MRLSANPLFCLVRAAWTNSAGQRPRVVLFVLMSVAGLSIQLCEPFVVGRILNTVQIGPTAGVSAFVRSVALLLLAYVGIQVGFWSLHGPSRVIERGLAFQMRVNFQMRLFNIVMALPIGWHKDNHSGAVIDKINRAISALFDFAERSFEVVHLSTRFCGSLVILFFFMRSAALIALAAAAAAISVVLLFDKVLIRYYQDLNRQFNHTAAAVHDYVTNIVTVLSLRLENNVSAEVMSRIRRATPLFRRNAALNELKWFVTTMMVVCTIAGILVWYTHSAAAGGGALMAGTFFTLFEYLRRIGDSFYGFAWKYGQLVQLAANVRGAETITSAFDETLEVATRAVLPEGWREVAVSGLDYTYEDDKHRLHHLKDISLTLARGKTIALVGASGAGKSTLLSILRGLRTPPRVAVTCDGARMPHGLAHVAHHATLIPQAPEIFADTVRFNVTMGLEAADEEILAAMRLARFDDVLKRLPSGLDTNIAEKGVNLSGGENQRLALARGVFFARQSDLILLDEPTSSVDFHNERIIYENLLASLGDRCVISAIHRLHLLPMFDEIVVMSDGIIVERGPFAELLAREGLLAKLVRDHQIDDAPEAAAATQA